MGRNYTPPKFAFKVEQGLRRLSALFQPAPWRIDPWQEGQSLFGKPVHAGLMRIVSQKDKHCRALFCDLCDTALAQSDAAFFDAVGETMRLMSKPKTPAEKWKHAVAVAYAAAASRSMKDGIGTTPDWTCIHDVIKEQKLLPAALMRDSDKTRREIMRSVAKLKISGLKSGLSKREADKLPAPDDFTL